MATILKPAAQTLTPFPYEDVAHETLRALEEARAEAKAIVAAAAAEADDVRRRAEEDGRRSGVQSAEQVFAVRMDEALHGIRELAAQLARSRQAWLARWEEQGIKLAAKMAERIVRRQIECEPQITLDLVREALEMAAPAPTLRIGLNPADYSMLGAHADRLARELASAASARVVADAAVSRGGCRLETQYGVVDQQIETQLDRMIAELLGDCDMA